MNGSARPRATLDRAARRSYLSKLYRGRVRWWWPLVAVLAGVALLVTWHLAAAPPPTVARVVIVNNTAYDIEVAVTGAGGGGTLSLGTAPARATTEVHDVIDQGPTWVVHFRAQGEDGGELRIARADLDHSDWKVVIPADVARRLAAAGLQESPIPTG